MVPPYFSAMKREYDPEAREMLRRPIKDVSQKICHYTTKGLITKGHSTKLISHKVTPQELEIFTLTEIVNPLLTALGYKRSDKITVSDFTLFVEDKIDVVVAPYTTDLNHGMDQIKKVLQRRGAEYSIVTNGFLWILIKVDRTLYKIWNLVEIDLRPVFMDQSVSAGTDMIVKEFYESFFKKNIVAVIKEKEYKLNQYKEIFQHFYAEYMGLVFGIHHKKGTITREYYLLKAIQSPPGTTQDEKGIFAVNFMNRLFFIKFLESAGVIPYNLLKDLVTSGNCKGAASVYKSVLKPLFFNVFNTPFCERESFIQEDPFNKVPYLHDGLFQPVVEHEDLFDIHDDIVKPIIEFIEGYTFTISGEGLDPDIMGTVFEKTINYLSTPGSDAQKAKGAFYTPEDVVTFIVRETLYPYLLDKLDTRWREGNKKGITPALCIPKEKIKKALTILDTVTILDPACGSGDFLLTALKELVSSKERFLDELGEEYDVYELKKKTIKQVYGVDIERSAVEITKLRLWLYVLNDSHTELPPIHIYQGDSLRGWLDEKMHPLFNGENKENKISHFGWVKGAKKAKMLSTGEDGTNRFHWGIFHTIIKKGGFDIVIGNPPYIEVPKGERGWVNQYYTSECGNTHAYFYERALRLVKKGGFCGFIVPVSSISTDRMKKLQKLLMRKSSALWVSSYDDRPGKLFRDLEHCRSAIIISKKKCENEQLKIFTTKYNRWFSEDRPSLFKNITYTESTDFVIDGAIPKIGSPTEMAILKKIRKDTRLTAYLEKTKKAGQLWVHNAPQYWIRGLDFVPYFRNEREGQKISNQMIALNVHPEKFTKVVGSVLNSSLFYWFFILHSDGRHLVKREIENFPLSIEKIPNNLFILLKKVFDELMDDYKRTKERKVCYYKTTGKVEYDVFYPGESKQIIDKIDDIFAAYYGFTSKERDFIKNFDRTIRMRE